MTDWRRHPEYSAYEISDDGRVRSIDRLITYRNGVQVWTRGRELSPSISNYGYHIFNINISGKGLKRPAHQLVAETFIGPRPPGYDIRHLSGDKLDNHVGNLAYGTRSENILDAVRHGTHRQTRKTHCDAGHELTEENIYRSKTGRCCRVCRRNYTNAYYQRKKSRGAAQA